MSNADTIVVLERRWMTALLATPIVVAVILGCFGYLKGAPCVAFFFVGSCVFGYYLNTVAYRGVHVSEFFVKFYQVSIPIASYFLCKTTDVVNLPNMSRQVTLRAAVIAYFCWVATWLLYLPISLEYPGQVPYIVATFPAYFGAAFWRLDSRYGQQWQYAANLYNKVFSSSIFRRERK